MKTNKVSLIFLVILISFAFPQDDNITADQAHKYVGEIKTVCGVVASTFYSERSRGKPTFLNLDKPFPNQVFTIVIWGQNRKKFDGKPDEIFLYKDVCVKGLIEEYNGLPQIDVQIPNQIVFEE